MKVRHLRRRGVALMRYRHEFWDIPMRIRARRKLSRMLERAERRQPKPLSTYLRGNQRKARELIAGFINTARCIQTQVTPQ